MEKKWSRQFDKCVTCFSTEYEHHGHGVCTKCRNYFLRRLKGIPEKGKNWSYYSLACVECGTTEIKHCGKGLCRKCWTKKYQKKPKIKENVRKQNLVYYEKYKEILRMKRMQKYYAKKKLLNETRSARVSISNMIERPESK